MKSWTALAWKELKTQKVTSCLLLIAVILSSLMSTVAGQSVGLLQSLRTRQAAQLNGDRYATFHQLTKAQVETLEADPRLKQVGSLIQLGDTPLGSSSLTLYLREYTGRALDAYPALSSVVEGHLPESAMELALPGNALEYLDFTGGVGDSLTLPLTLYRRADTGEGYAYTATFTLCGILADTYLGYTSGIVEGVVGVGTAAELLPEEYLLYTTDFKTRSSDRFQTVVADLATQLGIRESSIQYNGLLLDALGIPYPSSGEADTATGFSLLGLAWLFVGGLVLLAAGLVVYNVLKIAVSRRLPLYGTLRAIGGEQRQLYALVGLQLLLLCGAGIPLGVLLGLLSTRGLLVAALGFFDPALFLSASTQELATALRSESSQALPLAGSVALTLLFAALAAFPAAHEAGTVSPQRAMTTQTVKFHQRDRQPRTIRSFESFYARLNLRRSPGRTGITVLSMVMSIAVFVTLSTCGTLLDASSALRAQHLGDLAVTDETLGFSPEAVASLREQEAVASLSTAMVSVYTWDGSGQFPLETSLPLQSWEALHIVGLDEERLTALAPTLSTADRAALAAGRACLIKEPIPFTVDGESVPATTVSLGETVQVGQRRLQVVGVVEEPITINNVGFVNGVQVLVCDETYTALTGSDRYQELYPTLTEGADRDALESWLESWCRETPGSHWLSFRQTDAELAESFAQLRLLGIALILLLSLIGSLNIVNTVYTELQTRLPEIGIQRALGMSRRSLYQTFLWEGAYLAGLAAVLGGALGWGGSVLVQAAAMGELRLTPPLGGIFAAAGACLGICLLSTALPLRSIARLDLSQTLQGTE